MPITTKRNAPHRTPSAQAQRWRGRVTLVSIALAVMLFGIGGFLLLPEADPIAPGPNSAAAIGGPFALIDGDGKPVTDRDFRGKYLLVYFGYTLCPDVCPTTLTAVADAMQQLGDKAARVQPLFVTVDPQRDTPTVVKQYAAAFDPRLIGLTGTADQVRRVAHEYRVYVADHRTGPGANDYTVDHSSLLYLVGPDGRFITPIRADEPGSAIAADIAKHFS